MGNGETTRHAAYGYDAHGFLTSRQVAGQPLDEYEPNVEGRPAGYRRWQGGQPTLSADYTYDHLGIRMGIASADGGVTRTRRQLIDHLNPTG